MPIRILKVIAISGFLITLEWTKFVFFGRGSAPDPAVGAYSASPDAFAGLRGLLLREEERKGMKGVREGRKREEKEGK